MKDVSINVSEKELSAIKALDFVRGNKTIGLGTGSTTAIFIKKLGEKIQKENLNILTCTTSFQSFLLAKEAGIPVYPVSYFSELDLSVDGADEVDPNFQLIKGGGAAHTMEKIVHSMSKTFVCIVDSTKQVSKLGEKFPIPVEILPEAISSVKKQLLEMGARDVQLRMAVKKDGPVITDNGNFVLDVRFDNFDPKDLEIRIKSIPGVVENGIFAIYRPHYVIVGGKELKRD
ncbi:MAG: ribose 5-phosphate isomerase A [Leptospiraceae bacterium]|nr:ribose 5-phosphate isomerase A [Leptospiraceae bacterium]